MSKLIIHNFNLDDEIALNFVEKVVRDGKISVTSKRSTILFFRGFSTYE